MKLNTLTKGIATSILVGAFVLGVIACDKKESPTKTEPKQEQIEKSPEKQYSEISLELHPKAKTGQNLHIYADTFDGHGYWNVEIMKLYEDDVEIEERKGNPIRFCGILKNVKHEETGTHSYFVKIFYENGESRKSEAKRVEFTGEVLDMPPEDALTYVFHNELIVGSNDYGDNRGIVNVKVYKDEELWKEFDHKPRKQDSWSYDWFYKHIPLDLEKTGEHKYYAEFTDKGGNTVKTEEITINRDY